MYAIRSYYVSFGQGCEGDPILQAPTAAEAIRRIVSQPSTFYKDLAKGVEYAFV